ncbi:MAG: YihY/virulence factor BrkB family protein, partial [Acidobacteria bacterium]|nr:YihY/virulence factor BrkB family protein [Acidobacteriota bacterium]
MTSAWNLGGLSVRELVRRVWNETQNDNVFGKAAELSFYFLVALFPLLLFLTALFGYFAQGNHFRDVLFGYFARVLPGDAFRLVIRTYTDITQNAGSGKLSLGIIGTLWAASNAVSAIMEGANTAYSVRDRRPWWKAKLISLILTVALGIFVLVTLILAIYGNWIGEWFADRFGVKAFYMQLWNIGQWPVVLLLLFLAFAMVYKWAPDLNDVRWSLITPGAITGVALWLLVSLGFRLYLRYFNSYGATYGSLGAVIILLLWLYLSGAAILIGAEVNSEIENAAARSGNPEAKAAGEK